MIDPASLSARLPAPLRHPLLTHALAALVLIGAVLYLVQDRAGILSRGQEVTLVTQPVDPRDLFRGDFVVLGYEIGTLDLKALPGDRQFRRNDAIWVTLLPDAEGIARPVATATTPPRTDAGQVVIRGRVTSANGCTTADGCTRVRVAYGLESYFVPEGEGRRIEEARNARLTRIVAAVTPDGRAAIKRLLIDGRTVHEEPLY
jgi:uncharacterized membrane-anchored protein